MRTLYHLWLSPFCRKVRIALAEKNLDFRLVEERVWERRADFLTLNPAGKVPVLIDEDGSVIAESVAICEYLDEAYPELPLTGGTPVERAEVRRLIGWFDLKFGREVTEKLVGERVMKRLSGSGQPDSTAIRAAISAVQHHLDYIGQLAEQRTWLAGDRLSYADIAAAAHLSTIDYLDAVPWDRFEPAKDWYQRIKSRPSFRALLGDHIPGMPPPRHYADLDF